MKINKDIYNMNLNEYNLSMELIFNNDKFVIKDTIGKAMYSNGLVHYKMYLEEQSNSNVSFKKIKELEDENRILKKQNKILLKLLNR